MAQLIVAAAGAAIGNVALGGIASAIGMTGAGLGWMFGSAASSLFAPTQKSEGPRLNDLTVSSSQYGTPIPWLSGSPRVSGQIIWASAKRENANTTSQGKGGGGSEFTSYTYEVDVLYLLSDNQMQGVSRIWSNGELVYNRLALADIESLNASIDTTKWNGILFHSGDPAQLPDPTYSAAVGAPNALAYRGRSTLLIESLQLGTSGQLPNLTFEVFEYGTESTIDDLTRLQTDFRAGSSEDQSCWLIGPGVNVGGTVHDGYFESNMNGSAPHTLTWTDPGLARPINTAITFEFFISGTETVPNPIAWSKVASLKTLGSAGGADFQINGYAGAVPNANEFYYIDNISGAHDWLSPVDFFSSSPSVHHVAMVYSATGAISVYYDGVRVRTVTGPNSATPSTGFITLGGFNSSFDQLKTLYQGVRVRREEVYTGASFSPLSGPEDWPPPCPRYKTVTIICPLFHEVITKICLKAGMQSSQFDVTDIVSITEPCCAIANAHVITARQLLETLLAAYFVEAVVSGDKLHFRRRGRAVDRWLTYDDLGWYDSSQDAPDPFVIVDGNELELPAQISITYNNLDGDYQADTQYSDRLLTSMVSTSTLTLPIGTYPDHAKRIADGMMVDSYVAMHTTSITLGLEHAELEPTDVIMAAARDGRTHRVRLLSRKESGGVLEFACVFDDEEAFDHVGITDSGSMENQMVVLPVFDSAFELLDIPLLREEDNSPGFYIAVSGDGSATWRSAAIYDSPDDVTFTQEMVLESQAILGRTTTALASWTGGNVWDDVSAVTVSVDGELVSATSAEVIARRSTNAIIIGSEFAQYRTATLVSPGVYTLTGFLRGRRGTEWAMSTHAIGDRVVLISNSGIRFLPLEIAELGAERFIKVATAGQTLSTLDSESITPVGVVLKPFAPVLASADRTTGDTVIDWYRRTRLSTRITGPLAWSNPLGESSEAYEVDVWADGTYTTLKRTLTSGSSQVTYLGADQTTDFGAPQTTLYLDIYQISNIVGRGYRLRVAI